MIIKSFFFTYKNKMQLTLSEVNAQRQHICFLFDIFEKARQVKIEGLIKCKVLMYMLCLLV